MQAEQGLFVFDLGTHIKTPGGTNKKLHLFYVMWGINRYKSHAQISDRSIYRTHDTKSFLFTFDNLLETNAHKCCLHMINEWFGSVCEICQTCDGIRTES